MGVRFFSYSKKLLLEKYTNKDTISVWTENMYY